MSERRRLAAIFILCALAAAAIVGGALWRLAGAATAPPDTVVIVVLALAGLCAALGFIWVRVDRALLSPIARLARELDTVAVAVPEKAVDLPEPGALEPVVARLNRLLADVEASRRELATAVSAATDRLEDEKSRLAAILRDLSEGVIVCSADHLVLLFNNAARAAPGAAEALGLGRPLADLFFLEPVAEAFAVLQ